MGPDCVFGGTMDRLKSTSAVGILWLVMAMISGCGTAPAGGLALFPDTHRMLGVTKAIRDNAPQPAPIPRELQKSVVPVYLVEPGDVLLVEPISLDSPLRFPADQTVLVDGTIDLGQFGRLHVAGLSAEQIESQIESIISAANLKHLDEPLTAEQTEINVRLMAPNAAMYYVLGEVNSPGFYPLIGRETVLDAILTAGGLSDRASKENIVLARVSHPCDCRTVLPVCWDQIVQLGDSTTNYQIMPGDRIYVPTETCHEGMHRICRKKDCAVCEKEHCMTGACPPSAPPPTLYALPVEPAGTVHLPAEPKSDSDPIPMPPEPTKEKSITSGSEM